MSNGNAMKISAKSLKRLATSVAFLGIATFVVAGSSKSASAAETKVKVILNWKYEGPQGMFFLAEDRGYFKAAGIDVTFDQGNGSGAAAPLVTNGSYDIGFGDMSAVIELASKKPDEAPIAVATLYNEPPFVIAVKADGPIKSAKDLEGKTLGAPTNDGALKLFPAFCKLSKIDCSAVKITNMQPNLREQMLMQGQIDGGFGYNNTIRFSAKLMGVDPEKKLRFIRYADYGVNLYSNSIIVSRKLAKEHPEVVKGFLAALFKGINDEIKDPDAAVQAVAKREPLLKPALEKEKLLATLAIDMSAPEIATIGLGAADPARLSKSIDILVEASKLPSTPKPEQVFDASFLPPLADRPKATH